MSQPPLAVADVVRQYGAAVLARYGHTVCGEQHRALRAITLCRTAALGGHKTRCDHCGPEGVAYNPCRNRSGPKCHGVAQAAWREKRQREVLDAPYEHVVFRLPQDLCPLVLHNPRALYSLLLRSVSHTLVDIAGALKHLGAEIGGLAVRHTWGGQLQHHPHLHCVLPAGGIAADGSHWVPCRPHFFLPVRVRSRRFRRLYLEGLAHRYREGQLSLTGRCRPLAERKAWKRLLAALRDKEGVVYAKEPLPEPRRVLKSLARSTHRVAISHHRLVALHDGQVTCRFTDHKREGTLRTQTREAVEFLRRFVLHVLPRGLHTMRSFGFRANCQRHQRLSHCRTLLGQPAGPETACEMSAHEDAATTATSQTAIAPGARCPVCQQGRRALIDTFHRHRAAWDLAVPAPDLDTS